MDTAAIIEAESRELIRRRGLDAQADQLEPLIREVVADYDRRSSSGEVPVLHDDDSTVAEVAARIGGYGALQEMLDDPSVEEIWLNSPSRSAYFLLVQRACHQVTRIDRMRASDIRTGPAPGAFISGSSTQRQFSSAADRRAQDRSIRVSCRKAASGFDPCPEARPPRCSYRSCPHCRSRDR